MTKLCRLRVDTTLGVIATCALLSLTPTAMKAQSGWKIVKDKTGSCQISVPPDWTTMSMAGFVSSPQGTTTLVTSGHRPYRPFTAETLQVMNLGQVFENSATRAFWAAKPVGNPPQISYHIETSGKTNSCVAEIALPSNTSLDNVKKIAFSLSKTP